MTDEERTEPSTDSGVDAEVPAEPESATVETLEPEPGSLPASRRMSKSTRSTIEWVAVIAVALGVALAIRAWMFQPFWIPSESMYNTLQKNDRVLVNKLSYRLHDIHRGDVVVFEQPDSWPLGAEVKDLIKRVIGLPGEELTIVDCKVYVGGRLLVEPYVDGSCTESPGQVVDPDLDGIFTVAPGTIFVMGDNRTGSSDSRYNGFVPIADVVGRAFVVIWPIGHWSWL